MLPPQGLAGEGGILRYSSASAIVRPALDVGKPGSRSRAIARWRPPGACRSGPFSTMREINAAQMELDG